MFPTSLINNFCTSNSFTCAFESLHEKCSLFLSLIVVSEAFKMGNLLLIVPTKSRHTPKFRTMYCHKHDGYVLPYDATIIGGNAFSHVFGWW